MFEYNANIQQEIHEGLGTNLGTVMGSVGWQDQTAESNPELTQ